MGPLRVESDHARRHPGANKLATEVVINLIRTSGFLITELDRILRRYGITGAGFNVLMILRGERGPLSPFEIGERRLVTRGTVTGLLDTLEKQELVVRRPHPEDRRMLLIEVTEHGQTLLEEVCDELFPAHAEMMAGLTGSEKDSLVRLLGKLGHQLESRGSTP
ncbi:MAG: MarR family winged helix-turn-helix transcriptional regulator [Actinomycetota bacterium]